MTPVNGVVLFVLVLCSITYVEGAYTCVAYGDVSHVSTTPYGACPVGQYCGFFPGNNRIVVTGTENIDFKDKFSISYWVQRSSVSAGKYGAVINNGYMPTYGFDLRFGREHGAAYAFAYFKTVASSTNRYIEFCADAASSCSAVNRWVHIGMTYDGTNLKAYANGEYLYSEPITGNMQAVATPVVLASNGRDPDFIGYLDEVRVYTRVLAIDEMRHLYNSANPLLNPTTINNGLFLRISFETGLNDCVAVQQPSITSFSPSNPAPGAIVTINGVNFGVTKNQVTYNDQSLQVLEWSTTKIVTILPTVGDTSGLLVVVSSENSSGTASATVTITNPTVWPAVVGCTSWGDPHFVAFNAYEYNFQGQGEFLLTTIGDLEVQTRQGECPNPIPGVTCNSAVAVRYKADIFAVYRTEDKHLVVQLNNKTASLPITTSSGLSVSSLSSRHFNVSTPDGISVIITYYWHMDVTVTLPTNTSQPLQPISAGLCGDLSGHWRWGNATYHSISSSQTIINDFGMSWRVTSSTSLFDYSVTKTSFSTHNPSNYVIVDVVLSTNPTLISQARTMCSAILYFDACAQHLLPGPFYDSCIFDILATGSLTVGESSIAAFLTQCACYTDTTNMVVPTLSGRSSVYGPGIQDNVVGASTWIGIQSRDGFGRPQTYNSQTQTDNYDVELINPAGSSTSLGRPAYIGGGQYRLNYTTDTTQTEGDGKYIIRVILENVGVIGEGDYGFQLFIVPVCHNGVVIGSYCRCNSGFTGAYCSETAAHCPSYKPHPTIESNYPSLSSNQESFKFTGNNLLVSVVGPFVENRTYTSITFLGATGSRCSWNEDSYWVKSIDSIYCKDNFHLTMPWDDHNACGFVEDGSDSNILQYKGTIQVTYTDELGTIQGIRLTRNTSVAFDVYVGLPKTITLSMSDIEVRAAVDMRLVLTNYLYNSTSKELNLVLTSILSWPNMLTADAGVNITEVPSQAVGVGNALLQHQTCSNTQNSDCVQQLLLTFKLVEGSCDFNGHYTMETTVVTCRENSGSGCTRGNITIAFSIQGSSVCNVVGTTPTLSGELQAVAENLTTPSSTWRIGQTGFFVTKYSGTNTVTMIYRDISIEDPTENANTVFLLQDGIPTTLGTNSQISINNLQNAFSILFTSNAFNVPVTETKTFTIRAVTEVVFSGNKRDVVATIGGKMSTSTKIVVTPNSLADVTPEQAPPSSSEQNTIIIGSVVGGVGLLIIGIIIIIIVIVRRKKEMPPQKI